ncbi:MAG: DJ-1/PfpI family protein, partial [Clostridiales bacterium]|nr:DJ-1/PfpI family protein [Clostridiales bacterium]
MYEAIVFFVDGFEEIEAITTLDILRRGNVNVVSVSLTGNHEVTGSHDITVKTDMVLDGLHDIQGSMLILPGGPGTATYKKHKLFLELLRLHNSEGGRIAAICAAPTVLGVLKILENKTAVCYPTCEDDLHAKKIGQLSTITDGNITTSKGPGTSADFALELVRILKGDSKAAEVATGMLIF